MTPARIADSTGTKLCGKLWTLDVNSAFGNTRPSLFCASHVAFFAETNNYLNESFVINVYSKDSKLYN